MKIRAVIFLVTLMFFNCASSTLIAQEKYSLVIAFIGKDFEKKVIDISFNDNLTFKNLNMGERMYPVGLYEFALGFKDNEVYLHRLRNGQIIKKQKVNVNNLEKLKFTIIVDSMTFNEMIDIKKVENYHLEYSNGKVELLRAKG